MSDMAPEQSGFTEMSNAAEAAALAGEAAPEAPVSDAPATATPEEALVRDVNQFDDAWSRPGDEAEPDAPAEPEPAEEKTWTNADVEQALADAGLSHLDRDELNEFLRERPDIYQQYFSERAQTPQDLARNAALADSLRRTVEAAEQQVDDAHEWAVNAYEEGDHEAAELLDWMKQAHGFEAAAQLARELDQFERPELYDDPDEPLSVEQWAAREVAAQQQQERWAQTYAVDIARRQQAEQEAAIRSGSAAFLDEFAKVAPDLDELAPSIVEIIERAGGFEGVEPQQAIAFGHRAAQELQRVEAVARVEAEAYVNTLGHDPWAPALSESELARQREAQIQARMADNIMEKVDFGRLMEPPSRTEFAAQQQDAVLAEQRRLSTFDDAAVGLAAAYEAGVARLTPQQLKRRETAVRDFDYERSVVAAAVGGQSPAERTAAFTRSTGGTPAPAKRALPDGTQTIREWQDSWGS